VCDGKSGMVVRVFTAVQKWVKTPGLLRQIPLLRIPPFCKVQEFRLGNIPDVAPREIMPDILEDNFVLNATFLLIS
jgi:hypothetical protein